MSDYPLLTKVLADAWAAPAAGIDIDDSLARELIEGIPPAIADGLEAALDSCQFEGDACGVRQVHPLHKPHRSYCKPDHAPNIDCHPFVPLVQP